MTSTVPSPAPLLSKSKASTAKPTPATAARLLGAAADIVLSPPMLIVKVPAAASRLTEANATVKLVSPCEPTARESTGSTV